MVREQYVCERCGYNMAGYYPVRCPFCGAPRSMIITMEECIKKYSVKERRVTGSISELRSSPELGYEHSAYLLRSREVSIMIDCPSSFDRDVPPVEFNLFTHHHFLGASNRYRETHNSKVYIHEKDSRHDLCRGFVFDEKFEDDFTLDGVEAYHVDGHTPGFTCYIFDEALFICDYVFAKKDSIPYRFNPFGPRDLTVQGAEEIGKIIEDRELQWVCGQDYVSGYSEWKPAFDRLIRENT